MIVSRALRGLAVPALGFASAAAFGDAADVARQLKAPPGFQVSVWAASVPGARSMARGEGGTVFVGTRGAGVVYAVVPSKDETPARVLKIATGLNTPNGVAVRDGSLYVAEINRILRYDDIERQLDQPPAPVVVVDDLPSDRHHGWKYIAFGPDGKLYVPVGAPCNVCESSNHALILRMNPDGKGREVFARGVRNTVGFTWHPRTGDLWFTENGRDWLGDDRPPDELNRAPRAGLHFGFPFCHGGDIADPELGGAGQCAQSTPPAHKLGAHVAALGLKFYGGAMLPQEYRGQIVIAEHGSWNRSSRVGYQLSLLRLDGNRVVSYEPFVTGWNQPQAVLGRPVDLLELTDGSLLVSDDGVGAIYRITYR